MVGQASDRKMVMRQRSFSFTRLTSVIASVAVALLSTNNVARLQTTTTTTTVVVDAFNMKQAQQQQQRRTPIRHHQYQQNLFDHARLSSVHQSSGRSQLSSLSSSSSDDTLTVTKPTTSTGLYPKIGDVVRYYDLDGGEEKGETIVGRIGFIFGSSISGWKVELTGLEPIGDGYYAEYSSTKRSRKKTERPLLQVAPVMASYVQSEQAWKVPMNRDDGTIIVRQETYDVDTYGGPMAAVVDPNVLQSDAERYNELKGKLLKQTLLAGLIGAAGVDLWKGQEDAAIYFAGSFASVLYLLFLSFKTDTVATASDSVSGNTGNSASQRLGTPLSNLRFFMPVLVLLGVSSYNASRGELNPLKDTSSMFDTVTREQFTVAILGFLTYRIPLFVNQIRDAFKEVNDEEEGLNLPGSAGVALKVLQEQQQQSSSDTVGGQASSLTTVLLVSGPQATGRSELISKLLEQDDRLVEPVWTQRLDDGATFERLEQREEFLTLNAAKSAGLTKEGVLAAASNESDTDKVVVVDADIELAKKLQRLSGARLIGVWVGLESVADFEKRLAADIDSGKIAIPPEETRESVIRARIKEIITEIEFGLASGIFEFTILNQDEESSLRELKQAAEYAFK
eukprot:CAMPEP_0113507608 /NCGR_PEP_ID=MMETSP0014_2-20120614/36562_1 /TAXON_ID=2857 /ORGANISM="Nitzschia sp." /LENGTH=622 /DNA_ID=CAMNT_0000403241 /DNA_START=31 /DNA_END=1899 /DNA_ORIENTATION=- /assembly_acc=CAM_ASM_000159